MRVRSYKRAADTNGNVGSSTAASALKDVEAGRAYPSLTSDKASRTATKNNDGSSRHPRGSTQSMVRRRTSRSSTSNGGGGGGGGGDACGSLGWAQQRRFWLRTKRKPRIVLWLYGGGVIFAVGLLALWAWLFVRHSTLTVSNPPPRISSDVILSPQQEQQQQQQQQQHQDQQQKVLTNDALLHPPTVTPEHRSRFALPWRRSRPKALPTSPDMSNSSSQQNNHRFYPPPIPDDKRIKLLLSSNVYVAGTNNTTTTTTPFHWPSNAHFDKDMGRFPDFGHLKIAFFDDKEARRTIYRDSKLGETEFRLPDRAFDDDVEAYHYFDDDYLRGLDTAYDETDKLVTDKSCRRISEHRLNLHNCNDFHSIDRLDPAMNLTFINAGAYREVFGMVHSTVPPPSHDHHHHNDNKDIDNDIDNDNVMSAERFALKDIRWDSDMEYDDYEFVRMDAIVAERLTASPRIYDIYGFCGLGILSEFFHHGDLESDVTAESSDDKTDVQPQNQLTGMEKLVLSLEMAEALADLHGHATGLIVHDDVQLSQFLFNQDKTRLKLNDFNRAEFPLFDEAKQEYCHYTNGRGHGTWRAPEEYKNAPLTEAIDVWSFGNNMYTLLTGLFPGDDDEVGEVEDFTRLIMNGTTALIDPQYANRSMAEATLFELIPKCFHYQAKDRPSIFEIVAYLREAVKSTLPVGTTIEAVLQGIKTRQ